MSDYSFNLVPCYFEAQGEEGPYIDTCIHVGCSDAAGHTWVHFKSFRDEQEAQALVSTIQRRVDSSWEPNHNWTSGSPIYGSQAFCGEGGEAGLARVDVEAEYGPGSYTPNHPGYLG